VLTELIYKTSQYCPSGNCVEVAVLPDGAVAVRDSKGRNKPPHMFTAEEWTAFIAGIKAGDFDLANQNRVSSMHSAKSAC